MEPEFVECIQQTELENNMFLVIKGNVLKRKREETIEAATGGVL